MASRNIGFGSYEVDLEGGQVYKRGVRLRLRDQSFRVLAMLLERPGQAVTREELRRRLWPEEVFVDFDNALNSAIARLREVLHDCADRPRFIETLPKRGYRFVAPVTRLDTPETGRANGGASVGSSTHDPVAYQEYAQGRRLLDRFRSEAEVLEAIAHLQRAVGISPGFTPAHDALAQAHWLRAYVGWAPPSDAFAAGILHAVQAVEIDNGRGDTHALLAQYHKQFDYNWPEIERELRRALAPNGGSAFVRSVYAASWLMPQGRLDEAIAELESVAELDPASIWVHNWLGVMLVLARNWDRGIEQGRVLLGLDSDSPWGYWLLATGLRGKGAADEAIAAQRRAVELSGRSAMMLAWYGLVLGAAGRTEEARAVLTQLEEMATCRYVPPTSFAWLHLALGEVDRAFEWLDRAIEARDQFMMPIKTYAFLDPLRPDPRFAALLRKMNLDK